MDGPPPLPLPGRFAAIAPAGNSMPLLTAPVLLRQRAEERCFRPLSADHRARVATIEDLIGPVVTWPNAIRELFFQPHLRYNERCRLSFFLLGNRLPPLIMAEWYLARGMLRDRPARDHIASIIKDHKLGALAATGKTAWVMHATDPDKVQLIVAPDFASKYEHEHFWDDAIALLKNNQTLTPNVAHAVSATAA